MLTVNRCSHKLVAEFRDGLTLTPDEVTILSYFFGNERVFEAPSGGDRLFVWLFYQSRMTYSPLALRRVGYGALIHEEDHEVIEDLARVVGAEILGTTELRVGIHRVDNGEGWVFASCSKSDYKVVNPKRHLI